jgi:hypothetical protein
MIYSIIVAVLALALLLFVIWMAISRPHSRKYRENPAQHLRPVDVEAFRNLIDPAEEDFLRSRLPHAEFRKIQRERLGAAVAYITDAAHNAGIMVQLADAARHGPDPAAAQSAQKLLHEATQLRLYAYQALPRLYLAMAFPSRRTSPLRVAESYEQMTQRVVSLGVQYPASGISAVL